jgi:hypothetical protein
MVKEQIHKHINENPDSIEISTASKGGGVKIYSDYSKPDEFKKKIDIALELRAYAQNKLRELEKDE